MQRLNREKELNESQVRVELNTIAEYHFFSFFIEMTIHTLPHLKYTKLVSVRSSHLPFKMHSVGFQTFKSPLYYHKRANRLTFYI